MDTNADRPPTHVGDLLDRLLGDPGRPRLTWYGEDGERVELSGAVLVNWVNKTTNLLVEEFDAGPGTTVLLDLPGHWRTLVWALAAWRVGACVVDTRGGTPDVVVTTAPEAHAGAPELVAVALPALARAWPGPLPAGAIDAAGAVMTYGDQPGPVPPVDPAAPAVGGDRPVRHADLVTSGPGGRTLLPAADGTGALRRWLAVLASSGSLVLVDAPLADRLRADPGRRDRLVGSERVEHDLLDEGAGSTSHP
ncbi:TIGR03089 family protein [Cellulomonas wangleii]|uniref:TIGR03089 family protein n=1 Tax=Cellulomonas wangleii TaxID=2816956 RepID=UPI0020BEF66B|nr:TIGR03089 family protein [Cellulomonas wangleii]